MRGELNPDRESQQEYFGLTEKKDPNKDIRKTPKYYFQKGYEKAIEDIQNGEIEV